MDGFMIRNILDWEGNIVGELDLPDDTPEEVWQEKLSAYNQPPAKTVDQIVNDKIAAAKRFGGLLLNEVSTDNVLMGATTAQVENLIEVHKNIIIMLMSGSLLTALQAVETLEPDELLTEERLKKYASKIRVYLGIP